MSTGKEGHRDLRFKVSEEVKYWEASLFPVDETTIMNDADIAKGSLSSHFSLAISCAGVHPRKSTTLKATRPQDRRVIHPRVPEAPVETVRLVVVGKCHDRTRRREIEIKRHHPLQRSFSLHKRQRNRLVRKADIRLNHLPRGTICKSS